MRLYGNVANSVKVKVKVQIKSLYFGLDHSTSCDGLTQSCQSSYSQITNNLFYICTVVKLLSQQIILFNVCLQTSQTY